jgi:hypothetical protein
MKDRRDRRRHMMEPIEVSSPTLHGQVLNMSMDGLAIETATPIKPGKEVSLKIDGEGVTVKGSVRWSRLQSLRKGEDGESEPVYQAGISILQHDSPELAEDD